jgi:hypothetical protein
MPSSPAPVKAADRQAGSGGSGIGDLQSGGHPIKLFCCDLNWVRLDKPVRETPPAAPQDWAFISRQQHFDWHKEFGVNVMFCQAYTFGGYAFYPTKHGPVAPEPGANLFPTLFKLSRKAHMPFHSYFCVGADLTMSNMRNSWVIPTSRNYGWWGFLAPESPWTDLLCARVEEFLRLYVYFNVPYRKPAEELWVNHPMLNKSDMLLAESSDVVVPWLLSIRKPHQRVMTTIVGRQDGVSDPNT